MDFTQHNKINSYIPNQNRVMDCRQTPQNYNNNNAQQPYSNNINNKYQQQQFSSFPSYQQQGLQQQQQPSMQSQYQSHQQQQQQFHQNINRNSMPHHIGDGGNTSDRMSVTKCFKPYSFNSPTMNNCVLPQQNSSYFDDSMMIKSHDMEPSPMMPEDQIITMTPNDVPFWAKSQNNNNEINISAVNNNNDDLGIEYFQVAPPKTAPVKNKPRKNAQTAFHPVLETMKKFSNSEGIKKALENHQTFFFSHDEDDGSGDDDDDRSNFKTNNSGGDEKEVVSHQNSYRSRTKITQIPNGVRIITDIVKNNECGNEIFRNFRHLPSTKTTSTTTSAKDKRLKSKITLDEDDGNKNNNDKSNSNESDHDGDDEDGEENNDDCFKSNRKSFINL